MATSLEFTSVESLIGMYQFHFSAVFGRGEERADRREREQKPAINHKNHGRIRSVVFNRLIALAVARPESGADGVDG